MSADSWLSRRAMLRWLAGAAMAAPLAARGQGRCYKTPGAPECSRDPIPPLFSPTGWKTVGLDHLTFHAADPAKEAAFYAALVGWQIRSLDAQRVVMDIANWGSAVFESGPAGRAQVATLCFVIEPWHAETVAAALRARGLDPVADHDGHGFESFHVKDPDGFDLQLSNGMGLMRSRRAAPAPPAAAAPVPFPATGWKTVWLDHISMQVSNYKASVSFYCNLLGWKPTRDTGDQNECEMANLGDIIIRGGNPLAPGFAVAPRRPARIDHISWGIAPWDADAVRAGLEQRGLRAQADTSIGGDIHISPYKSFHTQTPGGFNLQISNIRRATRLVGEKMLEPK